MKQLLSILCFLTFIPSLALADQDGATWLQKPEIRLSDFPPGDLPSAAQKNDLMKKQEPKGGVALSAKYYYGIGIPVDYLQARYAAFVELAQGDDFVIGGSRILEMIYANGYGVKRNLDLALRIEEGEKEDVAPAEWEGRLEHLRKMMGEASPKAFDYCDDITSGLWEGYCADISAQIEKAKRDSKLDKVVSAWPQPDQAAFADLRKAKDGFYGAREKNEVDLSGTARAAMEIEERDKLETGFQASILKFEKGKFPHFTGADFKKADSELNRLYGKIEKAKDLESSTVTPDQIKETQRLWIPYREAWVKFGAVHYPAVSADSWRAWLTHNRSAQLKEFADAAKAKADASDMEPNFFALHTLAVDKAGDVYLTDNIDENRIIKISAQGVASALAGSRHSGHADGKGADASFSLLGGMALDPSGNLYVTDDQTIRKITPDGQVTTFAGSGEEGNRDGPALSATFRYPCSLAMDSAGNLYVGEQGELIRKISNGQVTTLAGSGQQGSQDGAPKAASFYWPQGLCVDGQGNLYVADINNELVRKVAPDGTVSTLAGRAGVRGKVDGMGKGAAFNSPYAVAVDPAGNIYVADSDNHVVRKITSKGQVATLAGTGQEGFADGPGASASFKHPIDLAVGPGGILYVADEYNEAIRTITPDGVVGTFFKRAP